MKVLSIMVDVTDLSDLDIARLQDAMEVQCEEANSKDHSDVPILICHVKSLEEILNPKQ